MINKNDLRKAISSIAISNAKRNTIYKAFSDLDSITKEEFDSVKSDISKVVESMLTKDTVGKANGVASLDSNGSVPIEQLGNIDTTLFLIVRELPTTDIKTNKIYLVPNQDGQGNNVYVEYLYVENVWEKLGEFKPEVDLSGYVTSDEIYQCIKKDYDSSKRGANSIAIDDSAIASGNNAIAIGSNSQATTYYSTALGYNAQAIGESSLALGRETQATGFGATALGYMVKANADDAIALGYRAQATGESSLALGYIAQATGDYSIALGDAQATGNTSLALGRGAQATGYYSTALGYAAQATEDHSIALFGEATGEDSLAIGGQATGESSLAIGGQATGCASIAIGGQSTGFASITLGFGANTSTISKYALGGLDENKQKMFNLEEITYSQYGNKKYLIGLGGYDGTNLTVTNNDVETLNPDIKSVQEIINEKADLVGGKLKAEQLPKLVNITNASTAEEVVTKFNTLLADLKAKGYMGADTAQ